MKDTRDEQSVKGRGSDFQPMALVLDFQICGTLYEQKRHTTALKSLTYEDYLDALTVKNSA